MSLYREHQASLTRSHTVSLSDAPPPISSIRACIECGVLYVRDDETHSGHLCKEEMTEEELQHPTMLMYPVSDNKSQAVSKRNIILNFYTLFWDFSASNHLIVYQCPPFISYVYIFFI